MLKLLQQQQLLQARNSSRRASLDMFSCHCFSDCCCFETSPHRMPLPSQIEKHRLHQIVWQLRSSLIAKIAFCQASVCSWFVMHELRPIRSWHHMHYRTTRAATMAANTFTEALPSPTSLLPLLSLPHTTNTNYIIFIVTTNSNNCTRTTTKNNNNQQQQQQQHYHQSSS